MNVTRRRNPRRLALAELRAILREVRPLMSYWNQDQTHRVLQRPLREDEKRENDYAAWVNLEKWARVIATRATRLADFAAAQAHRVARESESRDRQLEQIGQ